MEFRILGPLEVWSEGRQIRLGGEKQRALLAVLFLHRNEVVSIDRLIDDVWEGQPPATSIKTLQVHVSQLRKALRAQDRRGEPEEILVTQSRGYVLKVRPQELDSDRFEQLVEDGQRALRAGDPEKATRTLLEALALWRGPALADFAFDAFAQTEIARLEEARVSAIEERIDADLALGRHQALIGELATQIRTHPLRERLRGQLMLALYRSDRQAEALAAYQDARRMLDEELGLEPSESLQRLERAILVHDPALHVPDAVTAMADEPTVARRWPVRRRVVLAAALVAAIVGIAAVLSVLVLRGGESSVAAVGANAVGVVDSESGEIASEIPVGSAPAGLAVDADAIWVTNADDQTVSRIDPRENAVVDTIRVGPGPAGIAVGRGAVWVVNALDGTVSRIDPRTSHEVQRVSVGNEPTGIAYGLGALWVANGGDNTVSKIDAETGTPRRILPSGQGASGVAVGFGSVWVTSERTGNVSRLDPKSGAVVRTINVGNGPRAVAVGLGSVWVANRLDGTVSRIDPKTNTVRAVIPTAAGPSDIVVGQQTVWVANDEGASLTQIDPGANRAVRGVQLGNRPKGLALVGSSVLVSVRELGTAHRGGILKVYAGRRGLQSVDPAVSFESYSYGIPGMTSDGLVAYRHVGGNDGTTLVPDLASSLPAPTDAGRAYTFELRSGIRFSDGRTVRAEDFRRAIERLFRLQWGGRGYFTGLVGAAKCDKAPKTCDLSKSIVVDAAGQTVTYRLVAPDPDFLYTLTLPAAYPVPPGVPDRDAGTHPLPGTGPYKIASYVPNRKLVFVRNPFFRVWSEAARPVGYPDRIVWRLDVKADAATRAVEKGDADVAYDFVPPRLLTEVRTRYAGQLHVDPVAGTHFFLFDSRLRPFKDLRVRQALNYAVDRGLMTKITGAGVAEPTCQVLPQNFTGYRPYCPYTANPSASGNWISPNLGRAKRLVGASGTAGEAVTVWAEDKTEGTYLTTLLRRLGYRARLKVVVPRSRYDAAILDPRNKVQIGAFRWYADYPAASGFISSSIFDCSSATATHFCDRGIDHDIARARALEETDTRLANALWARIDRELTDQAPWLFLSSTRQADFVSSRVRNFQYNLRYGVLLDQLWVK